MQGHTFDYDFEDQEYHPDADLIIPVFGKGLSDPKQLAKSYSFHGEPAAVVPSHVVTVSQA
jgi:hypothetical protein